VLEQGWAIAVVLPSAHMPVLGGAISGWSGFSFVFDRAAPLWQWRVELT